MTAFDESGVVGHMFMCFTDPEKRILRLGYVVLDDRLRGKGYGREMILLAAKYAFEILKAEKITLGVFSNNPRAQRCYQSAGFTLLPEEKWKSYRVMNEDWECREMELTRK